MINILISLLKKKRLKKTHKAFHFKNEKFFIY